MTNDARTVRNIESAARVRADCARDLQEDHPGSTTECLAAWRAEMLERLRALDACDFHLTMSIPSELPQGGPRQGGTLEVDEIRQHVQRSTDAEPPAFVAVVVLLFCHLCTIPPADHLLNVDHGSIIRTWQSIRQI